MEAYHHPPPQLHKRRATHTHPRRGEVSRSDPISLARLLLALLGLDRAGGAAGDLTSGAFWLNERDGSPRGEAKNPPKLGCPQIPR